MDGGIWGCTPYRALDEARNQPFCGITPFGTSGGWSPHMAVRWVCCHTSSNHETPHPSMFCSTLFLGRGGLLGGRCCVATPSPTPPGGARRAPRHASASHADPPPVADRSSIAVVVHWSMAKAAPERHHDLRVLGVVPGVLRVVPTETRYGRWATVHPPCPPASRKE